jgi:hypothetical protein
MTKRDLLLPIVQVLLSACFLNVEGRHSVLHMKDDSRSAYLVEPFCFAPGGTVSLEVNLHHVQHFSAMCHIHRHILVLLRLKSWKRKIQRSTHQVCLQVRDFVLKNDGKVVSANGRVGFLIRHVDGAAYASTNVVDLAGQQCLLTQSPPNEDDRKVH